MLLPIPRFCPRITWVWLVRRENRFDELSLSLPLFLLYFHPRFFFNRRHLSDRNIGLTYHNPCSKLFLHVVFCVDGMFRMSIRYRSRNGKLSFRCISAIFLDYPPLSRLNNQTSNFEFHLFVRNWVESWTRVTKPGRRNVIFSDQFDRHFDSPWISKSNSSHWRAHTFSRYSSNRAHAFLLVAEAERTDPRDESRCNRP